MKNTRAQRAVRWWNRNKDIVITLAVIAAVFAALLGFKVWSSDYGCHSRWADSGRDVQWGLFTGCRVTDRNGYWLPERNVRDFN